MSQSQRHDTLSVVLGATTTSVFGNLIAQGMSVIVLGILGALGGWIFTAFIMPRLNKLFRKK
jgi:hypothetical protein